ncbi:MAG: hypothetical protein V3V33_10750 [Candidatus Lokiarchaeia archaeon]
MLLEKDNPQELTELVKKLLNRLYEVKKQEDIDPIVFELQKLGYRLNSINNYTYMLISTFIKNDAHYELQIPYYKINEDILEQLKAIMEEYFHYVSEKMQFQKENPLDIDMEEIDWDDIYRSRIYAKLSLQMIIELLYEKLYEELSKVCNITEMIEI